MAANPTLPDNDARLWDALPGMVLLLATDGAALKVNDAFCAFAGRPREDLLGHGWSTTLLAASRSALLDRLGRSDDFMLGVELTGADGAIRSVVCLARRQSGGEQFTCILHNVREGLQASPSAQARRVSSGCWPTTCRC
jgi:PAS domain-containing protein